MGSAMRSRSAATACKPRGRKHRGASHKRSAPRARLRAHRVRARGAAPYAPTQARSLARVKRARCQRPPPRTQACKPHGRTQEGANPEVSAPRARLRAHRVRAKAPAPHAPSRARSPARDKRPTPTRAGARARDIPKPRLDSFEQALYRPGVRWST